MSCLLGSGALLLLLLTMPQPAAFWRAIAPPLGFLGAAMGWLVIVQIIRTTTDMDGRDLPYAPDLFLPKFLATVGGIWSLLIGAMIGNRPDGWRLTSRWIGSIVNAFTAASLVRLWVADDNRSLFMEGRFLGLSGNANVTAAICGVGLVLGLAGAMAAWRDMLSGGMRGKASFWIVHGLPVALNACMLVLTESRFPAVVAGVCLVLLWCHQAFTTGRPLGQAAWPALMMAGLLLFLVFLFSSARVDRSANVAADALGRWSFWQQFAGEAGEALWTGYGPGAFAQANLYFLGDASSAVRQTWRMNSPHNILLQLLFVGGVPYLLLIGSGTAMILRGVLAGADLRRFDVRHLALMLAAVEIVAAGMIDIALDVPTSTNLAMVLAGVSWGAARERGYSVGRASSRKTGR